MCLDCLQDIIRKMQMHLLEEHHPSLYWRVINTHPKLKCAIEHLKSAWHFNILRFLLFKWELKKKVFKLLLYLNSCSPLSSFLSTFTSILQFSSWCPLYLLCFLLILIFLLLLFFSIVYFKLSSPWFCLLFLFTILTFSPNTAQLDWCLDVWIILAVSYFFLLEEKVFVEVCFQPSG